MKPTRTLLALFAPALLGSSLALAQPHTYTWTQTGGASNFATVGNWLVQGGPEISPGPSADIVDPSQDIPLGTLSPLGFGNPNNHVVNSFTYTREDTWLAYAANSTTFYPTTVSILGDLSKSGTGSLVFRGNPSVSFQHNIKSIDLTVGAVHVTGGLLGLGADNPQVATDGRGSSHGALYGFSTGRLSIGSGTVQNPANSRVEFHVRNLVDYLAGTATASYATTTPGVAHIGVLHFHGGHTSHVEAFYDTTLRVGALFAESGTLTINGNVNFATAETLTFGIGPDGIASLVRQGGTWTFGGAHEVEFVSTGDISLGLYSGLITGLAADPGVANWSIVSEGWEGIFSYQSGSVNLNLTTIPEPGTYAMFGLGLVAWLVYRRRTMR